MDRDATCADRDRSRLMKLHKKSKSTKPRVRGVSGNRAGQRTDTADKDRLVRHIPSEPISSLNQTPLQDSEWLTLSPQDKYGFLLLLVFFPKTIVNILNKYVALVNFYGIFQYTNTA